jgi:hypothetical protein
MLKGLNILYLLRRLPTGQILGMMYSGWMEVGVCCLVTLDIFAVLSTFSTAERVTRYVSHDIT